MLNRTLQHICKVTNQISQNNESVFLLRSDLDAYTQFHVLHLKRSFPFQYFHQKEKFKTMHLFQTLFFFICPFFIFQFVTTGFCEFLKRGYKQTLNYVHCHKTFIIITAYSQSLSMKDFNFILIVIFASEVEDLFLVICVLFPFQIKVIICFHFCFNFKLSFFSPFLMCMYLSTCSDVEIAQTPCRFQFKWCSLFYPCCHHKLFKAFNTFF